MGDSKVETTVRKRYTVAYGDREWYASLETSPLASHVFLVAPCCSGCGHGSSVQLPLDALLSLVDALRKDL